MFEWQPLVITKGPSMPKEADTVLRLYKTLQTRVQRAQTEDEKVHCLEMLDALRSSVEARIEDLEEFYLAHDSDDRAILFEKQRLRLRRLLHSDPHAPGRSKPPAAEEPISNVPAMGSPAKPVEETKESKVMSSKSAMKASRSMLEPRPAPKLAYSLNMSLKEKHTSKLGMKRDKGKSAVMPIYSWEKGGKKDGKRPQIEKFGAVEFQIRLTEKEFFAFSSRRRALHAENRHKSRSVTTNHEGILPQKSLQSQGPYVDPGRVTNSIYRSPNKAKWINPKGLRPYEHL